MKKSIKMIATFMTAIFLVLTLNKNVFAATYSWDVTKSPGVQTASYSVKIPVYKGEMTFKVSSLTGNSSYLAAKCSSPNENYYYVNNSARCAIISRVNGEQSFYMKFINGGDLREYMYLKCSIEHNASIGELLGASGIIYY